jgi:branched-subunit amino acid ABC-type transport system permease component
MTRASAVNLALLALLVAVPLGAAASGAPFIVTLATKVAIFALAGVGLNLALGAALAGLAGALVGTIQSVQVGMGEPVLILAVVVIVIGGIGSIRGALVAALLVGLTDTLGRFLLPRLLAGIMDPASANGVGAAIASMLIYVLMAFVLVLRPRGLFGSEAS